MPTAPPHESAISAAAPRGRDQITPTSAEEARNNADRPRRECPYDNPRWVRDAQQHEGEDDRVTHEVAAEAIEHASCSNLCSCYKWIRSTSSRLIPHRMRPASRQPFLRGVYIYMQGKASQPSRLASVPLARGPWPVRSIRRPTAPAKDSRPSDAGARPNNLKCRITTDCTVLTRRR